MKLEFFVAGRPATQGSKRAFVNPKTGRAIVTEDNKRNKDWRAQVAHEAAGAMKDIGDPHRGPAVVKLRFEFMRPKSHYGTGRNAGTLKASAPKYHTQKPDCSKLQRCVEDAMTGIVWKDDSQAHSVHSRKDWSEREGVTVTVELLWKIKAIAPWFGGKRTMAPDIVELLGDHTQYFEPFCGSMSVLLAKPRSQKETVNDLHGDLVNLARVIQHEATASVLYDRLGRVLMCDGILEDARAILEDDELAETIAEENEAYPGAASPQMLERAYWYFIASWMGRNGTAGTQRQDYQIAVRWTTNGGSPTIRFRNAAESIPAWHDRLRNVVILQRDAFGIIGRFEDAPGTAIYADPPYPLETRGNHDMKADGTGLYKHEFTHSGGGLFGGEDCHSKLAKLLRNYQHAHIVVSTYDCDRYRELYAGWTFIDKTRQKNLHAQNGRGARPKEAPEVLICNRRTPCTT